MRLTWSGNEAGTFRGIERVTETMEDCSFALCLNISFSLLTAKQLFINHIRTSKYGITSGVTVQSAEASGRFQGELIY